MAIDLKSKEEQNKFIQESEEKIQTELKDVIPLI